MKILLIPLSLILIFVQLPFGPQPPEKPEEEKSPVKGWRLISYFATPPTQYSRVEKGIIKAESRGSRASLFKEVGEKERNFSVLSWKWKISNVVRSAIETRKDRFDAAARVMVVFGTEGGFRGFGGKPSGFKIEYIWASHLPKGHIFDHPGERDCKVFVLESGDGKAGQWVFEERNIHKDYKRAFGAEPGGLSTIGIQTDTDHSNEMVTAYYSDPTLKRK
ncbi:MAG TPA: DUF3047 domain-containing protein [Thermodesulfobacteriota bacterium]|jgi:hypothetical protein|nr:DUF3047 domain-containing protein [Thermodesulfobacteriota bacterium]